MDNYKVEVKVQKDSFEGKPMKRLFRLLSLDRKDIYLVIVYAILAGLIGLSLPLGIQAIINLIALQQQTSSWIVLSFIVAGGTAITGFMVLMQVVIMEALQQRLFARTAFDFAYRFPRLKMENITDEYAPELANRFFDTLNIQKGIPKIVIDLSASSLQIFFGLLLLVLYHPFFVFFGLILIVLLFAIIYFSGERGLKASLSESKYKYKVVYWLEELGRTMGSFKLAGRTQFPLEKTDKLVEGYLEYRRKHFNIIHFQIASAIVLKSFATLALLIVGGLLVMDNQMNIGQFVAAEIIVIMVLNALEKIVYTIDVIFDVLTGIEKMGNVTDLELEDDEGMDFKEVVGNNGMSIEIRDLSYQPEPSMPPILKDINIDIASGERVAITGFNASGKTTLLRILLGLYENYTGSIVYNGIPRRNINTASLRSYMGDYVSEEHLFNATLKENICMGQKNVSLQDVMDVCKLVRLDKYVHLLQKGLDTVISSEGTELPQSIIKKVLLARCIVDMPRFVATEPLLNNIETDDQNALLNLLSNRKYPWTLVAVTRSTKLAAVCDRVIVLDKGAIIFNGAYRELMNKPYFYNIFDHAPLTAKT
jgi:ABC-type bacteriocin/lantibiotic exporter with double-glycine peptidase domain